jgi:hypothetical protein
VPPSRHVIDHSTRQPDGNSDDPARSKRDRANQTVALRGATLQGPSTDAPAGDVGRQVVAAPPRRCAQRSLPNVANAVRFYEAPGLTADAGKIVDRQRPLYRRRRRRGDRLYRDRRAFTEVMHPAPALAMLSRGDLRLVLSAPGGGRGAARRSSA